MKQIILITSVLFVATFFVSCEIDNYDAPQGELYGQIRDAETGDPIQQAVPSDLGLRLRFYEAGRAEEQHFYAQMDGSFRSSHLFEGPIKLVLEERNFFPVDTIALTINGRTKKDIDVIPYVRILVENAGLTNPDNITVRFKMSRSESAGYDKHKITQYTILWHVSPYVDNQTINYTGKTSRTPANISDEKALSADYSVTLDLSTTANQALLKEKAPIIIGNASLIYIRVSVETRETIEIINEDGSTSNTNATYTNYSDVYPIKIQYNVK